MPQKTKKKMEKRAEVSFTFLVQTFIKYLLYTELQRETDIDDKGGSRTLCPERGRQKRGLRGLGEGTGHF